MYIVWWRSAEEDFGFSQFLAGKSSSEGQSGGQYMPPQKYASENIFIAKWEMKVYKKTFSN